MQRKKDLNRKKVAFEDYFNDKGYYPTDVDNWNKKENCGKNLTEFSNLRPWPCDPGGSPYVIEVSKNKFIVLTSLENKKDNDIPNNFYDKDNFNYVNYTNMVKKDILIKGLAYDKNDLSLFKFYFFFSSLVFLTPSISCFSASISCN